MTEFVLLSGVHHGSPLWMVPEESTLTDSDVGYAHMASAFSVPQALIHQDLFPVHLVSAGPSHTDAPSLKDVVDQMQKEDALSESNGSSASLETHPSETQCDKKVRGGHLGELLGLHQASDTIQRSKNGKSSLRKPSPFAHPDAQNPPLKHFLFQPNRHPPSKSNLHESKQHGSSNALDMLIESNPDHKLKDTKKSVKLSNKFTLGLSGTNAVSGVVGSLMYMAPEVYRGKQYDEKVDVFGFGVIMHELLLSELVIVRVLMQARRPSEMHHMLKKHARSVAKGNREEIPFHWPEPVKALIEACWHQSPDKRPRMGEVIERLRRLKAAGCIADMDQRLARMTERMPDCCSCCILT